MKHTREEENSIKQNQFMLQIYICYTGILGSISININIINKQYISQITMKNYHENHVSWKSKIIISLHTNKRSVTYFYVSLKVIVR